MTGMEFQQELRILEVHSGTNRHQDLMRNFGALTIEICHELTESREDLLRNPDIGLLIILFATDFVAFLQISVSPIVRSGKGAYFAIRYSSQLLPNFQVVTDHLGSFLQSRPRVSSMHG